MELKKGRLQEQPTLGRPTFRDQLVTQEDLESFRIRLINDLKLIMSMDKEPLNKLWLKSFELRKILKISPGTLQTLRSNGTLHFTKVGGIIFYNKEDMQRLLRGDNQLD